MMEVWKLLPPEYGPYFVSSFGRVRREKSKNSKGNILKPGNHTKGYSNVSIKGKTRSIHRLVGIAFLGLKQGQQINHKDGNKKNNHLSNLETCTQKENQIHRSMVLNKRNPRKVDAASISEIVRLKKEGHSNSSLAKKYGYTNEGITYICKTEAYRAAYNAKIGG